MTTMLVLKRNDTVDVSYWSKHFGFIFPVLINKNVWTDNYADNDSEMLWLDELLDACACELNSNKCQIDSQFEYKREGEFNIINLESSLEFDENINPYILIKYPDKAS